MTRGRKEEAQAVIRRIAKGNRTTVPRDMNLAVEVSFFWFCNLAHHFIWLLLLADLRSLCYTSPFLKGIIIKYYSKTQGCTKHRGLKTEEIVDAGSLLIARKAANCSFP